MRRSRSAPDFWCDIAVGMGGLCVGLYFRNVTELLLFGVRGKNNRTLAPGRRQVNMIATRKREHSRKPDEVYPLIESCSKGPYLELFARERRKNWTIWGNEAPEDENRFNGKTNGKAYSLPLRPEKHDTLALNF